MPWKETDAVNERMQFMIAARKREEPMAELCRRFGISRKTGYKLLHRFEEEGFDAARDRSRAPRSHPNQTPPQVEAAILRTRKAYPSWGSKKILAKLSRDPAFDLELPARSTIDAILKRAGLVQSHHRRRRPGPSAAPLVDPKCPNDLWSMDYKGWFRVADRTRCDPLTVNDVFSRYSLLCEALVSPKLEDVRVDLEWCFREYGLPRGILSDTGAPFASQGLRRLSRLGVWLIRAGVQPVFIQPGHPEQNGRHERFHSTLKRETATPPKATIRAQQRAFDAFQIIYNEERPHEALDMEVPAALYECSERQMPDRLPDHEYGEGIEPRRVRRDGYIRWNGSRAFVGEAMRDELVGVERVDDGVCHVLLGPVLLGALHERSRIVAPVRLDQEDVTHVPGQGLDT